MTLPEIRISDGIGKSSQVKFYGFDHRLGAADGAIWDMQNMSSRDFPILSTRRKRALRAELQNPNGMYGWGGLAWVDGTDFCFNGAQKGTVADSKKTFAGIGSYIIILPDKKYYNIDTDEFGSLESEWSGASLTFGNGTLYGEAADANAIIYIGMNWSQYFREGDAVTISGCTIHPENNKSAIIREISGDELHFYENIFTLDGLDGDTPYTETGSLSIKRDVPDMLYMFENENRLWGCSKDTIYASKLGDIFNWNVYDGLDTDSYAVDTGSASDFLGCAALQSYPTFFKEDHIYKIYGDKPSNYQVVSSSTLGLELGSGQSMAVSTDVMHYLARTGFVSYTGGTPNPLSEPFGNLHLHNGVGGSDGLKYYCSALDTETNTYRIYVYDLLHGVWHVEDELQALAFAYTGGQLYMLDSAGKIWKEGPIHYPDENDVYEDDFPWYVEFADMTEGSPNRKGFTKIQIRLELDPGAKAQVWIRYRKDADWQKAGPELTETPKDSFYLPTIPQRCDYYGIKITGQGGCRIYQMTRETYSGSEFRS